MKIDMQFDHGLIEGQLLESKENKEIVIITNGHNGFYNYGMFPYIQSSLLEKGISSFSYNFSHGGVVGDSDTFNDLEKYEKNCMRLEKLDVINVHKAIVDKFPQSKVYHLTHSLGGIPVLFGIADLESDGFSVDGAILLATIKQLDVWPAAMMKEWKEKGVYLLRNNRTNQDLPQGKEFLEEILNSEKDWNVMNTLAELNTRFLFVHGKKDTSVSYEHSVSQFIWSPGAELSLMEDATHTLNTTHPFGGTSEQLESFIKLVVDWVK